jgi:DNA invertase Pin-like site-specific DNA recombinase
MLMGNALVVRKTHLPKSLSATRAAQYVRMSTDHQHYSIENQAVVIGAYAQARNLSIVRTYRDEGESGLTLRNRAGLSQLLKDVQSDDADFDHILVYDVSRWGRRTPTRVLITSSFASKPASRSTIVRSSLRTTEVCFPVLLKT